MKFCSCTLAGTEACRTCSNYPYSYHVVNDVIKSVSSVQPERKKGKWILDDNTPAICSECGANWIDDYVDSSELYFTGKIPNYCPNCGSDNRGEQDE